MKKCSILLAAILSTVALVGCSGDKDKAPEKKEEAKTEVAAPAGEHKDAAAAEEKKADDKAAHADKDHADKKDEKKSEKDEEDDEDEE